jgi:hypothetical protein
LLVFFSIKIEYYYSQKIEYYFYTKIFVLLHIDPRIGGGKDPARAQGAAAQGPSASDLAEDFFSTDLSVEEAKYHSSLLFL